MVVVLEHLHVMVIVRLNENRTSSFQIPTGIVDRWGMSETRFFPRETELFDGPVVARKLVELVDADQL